MFGDGYRCDRCMRGWHATPTCPFPPAGTPLAPSLVELTRHISSIHRVGEPLHPGVGAARRRPVAPLPPVQAPPWAGMRWWWPVVAVAVFVALVILI